MERVRYDLLFVINTLTLAVACNSAVWAVLLCVSAHQHRVPFLGIQPSNVPTIGSLEQIATVPMTIVFEAWSLVNAGKISLMVSGFPWDSLPILAFENSHSLMGTTAIVLCISSGRTANIWYDVLIFGALVWACFGVHSFGKYLTLVKYKVPTIL